MDKVYRLKDNIEFDFLEKIGFNLENMPEGVQENNGYNFYRIAPGNDELKQFLLERFYLNPEWIKEMYEPNKKDIVKYIGLRYNKNGEIRKNKKTDFILNNWKIEICEQDDFWIGFTSLDPADTYVYYNSKLLDKYFPDVIQDLEKLNLIEEYEVEPQKS